MRIGYSNQATERLIRFPEVRTIECDTGYVMDDQKTKTVETTCNMTELTPALQYTTTFSYNSVKNAPSLECESKCRRNSSFISQHMEDSSFVFPLTFDEYVNEKYFVAIIILQLFNFDPPQRKDAII